MAPRAPFSSPLAEELAGDVLERFVRYAQIDTQGALRVEARPSTEKQLDLSRRLVEELRETQRVDTTLFDLQAGVGGGTPLYLIAVEVED